VTRSQQLDAISTAKLVSLSSKTSLHLVNGRSCSAAWPRAHKHTWSDKFFSAGVNSTPRQTRISSLSSSESERMNQDE